jgi:hypothetical protein
LVKLEYLQYEKYTLPVKKIKKNPFRPAFFFVNKKTNLTKHFKIEHSVEGYAVELPKKHILK